MIALLLGLLLGTAHADFCFPNTCTPTNTSAASPTATATMTETRTNSGTFTATPTANPTKFSIAAKATAYNGVAAAGHGVPQIVASGNLTGQTGAVGTVCSFPASAGSYRVSGFVNVTAWTVPATFNLQVSYTDDGGTGRIATLPVTQLAGVLAAAITLTGVWHSASLTFNANAATITMLTAGTFTGSPVYNVHGTIEQIR